jgi:hypothetical protein
MSKKQPQDRPLWKELPSRVEIENLMGELDEDGLRRFVAEVLDAIYQNGHDPRFTKILSAWFRSLRFLTSPDFKSRVESVRTKPI